MKVDINKLAEYFTKRAIRVEGIYRFTYKPGKNWPPYTEDFPGFVFPISGKLRFSIDGEEYTFTPGKVIHGGAKMDLVELGEDTESWEYILLHYEVLDEDLDDFKLTHFDLDIENTPRLHKILEELWEYSFQDDSISKFKTKVLFYRLMEEVFSCIKIGDDTKAQDLYKKVAEYIHKHYKEQIDVPRLAEIFEVNRNRLYYVFKKYSGMGPGQYLLNYRLSRAREIIFVENLGIQEISESVGFNDPFYFSRVFKKKYGKAPRDYRKKS